MRQKRVKSYRKVMRMYCSTFGFREPYQLLVDSAFLQSIVAQKLEFQPRLEDVLQGIVKPMITQCSIQTLYDSKKDGQAATDLAKNFERRKCNHFKPIPEEECLASMAGTNNPNRYVIATQSVDLRASLRKVPGLPIIYINRSVVLLETPSAQTLKKKSELENAKLHVNATELLSLNNSSTAPSTLTSSNLIGGDTPVASTSTLPDDKLSAEDLIEKKKKKKRGPKGPNPLSVKKKKVEPVERERKRPREDGEQGVVRSLAKRGAKRGAGEIGGQEGGEGGKGEEGGKKKRRRKLKKAGKEGGSEAVQNAGAGAGAAGGEDGSADE